MQVLSFLLSLTLLFSVAPVVFSETAVEANVLLEAPGPKEGETVIDFWCIMWEGWNQDWLKLQAYNFNAAEDRPFYVKLQLMDGDTFHTSLSAARADESAPDIICADYASVANNYRNGYVLDLKNLIPQSAWDDLLPSAKEFINSFQ